MSLKETKPNIAIFGVAGDHSQMSHLPDLATLHHGGECTVTALADPNLTGMHELNQQYRLNAMEYGDWRDALANETVDAVFVLTPDDKHTDPLIAAVQSGKDVFVEKPAADNMRDYEHLRDALATSSDDLMIVDCKPRRMSRPYVNTQAMLVDRRVIASIFDLDPRIDLGLVEAFKLSLNYQPPGRKKHDNFMTDHLPHDVDTLSHFLGYADILSIESLLNEELAFEVRVVRADGIQATLQGNRLQAAGFGFREDWQIKFTNGAIISVDAYTGVVTLAHNGHVTERIPMDETGKPLFITDYDEHFDKQNGHVVRAVAGREQPYLSREDLLVSTVAALAIQETNRPVSITSAGVVGVKQG